MTSHTPYFSPDRYQHIAEWFRQIAVSRETCDLLWQGRWKLSAAPRPFCVAVVRAFIFHISSVAISRWQGLPLNMNIWLPLFWSTLSRARGPDSATCAGAEHGRDYSCCVVLEQKQQKWLGHCFPWIVEDTWKTAARGEGFPTLYPHGPPDGGETAKLVWNYSFWHFELFLNSAFMIREPQDWSTSSG